MVRQAMICYMDCVHVGVEGFFFKLVLCSTSTLNFDLVGVPRGGGRVVG